MRSTTVTITRSRDMDIAIAEHVLEWQRLEGDAVAAALGADWDSQMAHTKRIWVKGGARMACEECGNIPQFSTDPAANYMFQQELRRRGYRWRVSEYDSVVVASLRLKSTARVFNGSCTTDNPFCEFGAMCKAALTLAGLTQVYEKGWQER